VRAAFHTQTSYMCTITHSCERVQAHTHTHTQTQSGVADTLSVSDLRQSELVTPSVIASVEAQRTAANSKGLALGMGRCLYHLPTLKGACLSVKSVPFGACASGVGGEGAVGHKHVHAGCIGTGTGTKY